MVPQINVLPGAMLRVDPSGRIIDINDAGRELGVHFSPEQQLVRLLAPADWGKLASRLVAKYRIPEQAREIEVCSENRRYRLSIAARACSDCSRFVQITDITEYRSLSEQIAMNEQRYRSLFTQNPDVVCSLDLQGRLVECNHATEHLTGHALEQLRWNRWVSLVDTADREAAQTCFEAALVGNPCSHRCKIRNRSGRKLVIQVTYMPILVNDQVAGIFCVARDKTERYRLEESRRLLQACMAQVQDVIFITEADPLDEPGPRIIYANEGLERVTGYSPEEVLGRTPRMLQGPDTDRAALDRIRAALEARKPIKEVVVNYCKDGEPFWNEIEIVHIAAGNPGQKAYFASVQRDVTRIKQREAALRQSQEELRRLSRAQEGMLEQERRRIARDLHDELGQTLTALKLNLGLTLSDLSEVPQASLQRLEGLIGHVDGAVEKVREIAANLRPAMLDDLGFEATAEWFLNQCTDRGGLEVRWWSGTAGTGRAKGEVATALFRILQECMTNVSRHSNASSVTVDYTERAGSAVLEINDNGEGFDPGQSRPFGFGLLGIRERVAMLDGTLNVESAIGRGVRIKVELPMEGKADD